MKKYTTIITLLATGLIGSNLWWAYQALDAGLTYTYREDDHRMKEEALQQSFAIIKAAALPDATQDSILTAAINSTSFAAEPFEKEGYIWVGEVGLRFSETGHLVEVVPAWSPFP